MKWQPPVLATAGAVLALLSDRSRSGRRRGRSSSRPSSTSAKSCRTERYEGRCLGAVHGRGGWPSGTSPTRRRWRQTDQIGLSLRRDARQRL